MLSYTPVRYVTYVALAQAELQKVQDNVAKLLEDFMPATCASARFRDVILAV